jgi:hypothetical protein
MGERFYAVDRVTSDKAIVVDDEGRAQSVPLTRFKGGIAETMVLRVPIDDSGEPDWAAATVDPDETERRRRKSAQFLQALQEHDPGADADL